MVGAVPAYFIILEAKSSEQGSQGYHQGVGSAAFLLEALGGISLLGSASF